MAGFPGVVGAIDCTYMRIVCPDRNNAMAFINGMDTIHWHRFVTISQDSGNRCKRKLIKTHIRNCFLIISIPRFTYVYKAK